MNASSPVIIGYKHKERIKVIMDAATPVIQGLEQEEIKVAESQEEYRMLPMLRTDDGYMIARFVVTDKDLENIKKTRSIYLYMMVPEGKPVTPILLQTEHPIPAEQEIIDARQA